MKIYQKINKKHGYIGAAIAGLLAIVHVTHLPILLLAFFGFVSTSIIENPIFKIIALIITISSVSIIMYLHTKKKNCNHKK